MRHMRQVSRSVVRSVAAQGHRIGTASMFLLVFALAAVRFTHAVPVTTSATTSTVRDEYGLDWSTPFSWPQGSASAMVNGLQSIDVHVVDRTGMRAALAGHVPHLHVDPQAWTRWTAEPEPVNDGRVSAYHEGALHGVVTGSSVVMAPVSAVAVDESPMDWNDVVRAVVVPEEHDYRALLPTATSGDSSCFVESLEASLPTPRLCGGYEEQVPQPTAADPHEASVHDQISIHDRKSRTLYMSNGLSSNPFSAITVLDDPMHSQRPLRKARHAALRMMQNVIVEEENAEVAIKEGHVAIGRHEDDVGNVQLVNTFKHDDQDSAVNRNYEGKTFKRNDKGKRFKRDGEQSLTKSSGNPIKRRQSIPHVQGTTKKPRYASSCSQRPASFSIPMVHSFEDIRRQWFEGDPSIGMPPLANWEKEHHRHYSTYYVRKAVMSEYERLGERRFRQIYNDLLGVGQASDLTTLCRKRAAALRKGRNFAQR